MDFAAVFDMKHQLALREENIPHVRGQDVTPKEYPDVCLRLIPIVTGQYKKFHYQARKLRRSLSSGMLLDGGIGEEYGKLNAGLLSQRFLYSIFEAQLRK